MATRIIFHKVVQDAVEFGSTETVSVSRVFFDLEHGGEMYEGLHVDVEEPADGEHRIEEVRVGTFQSPFELDRQAFEGVVHRYYQSRVTSAGYGKHLAKGKGFRSHGDVLGFEQVFEL